MKHDHKKTKKLKVALFAMVMFLPFIAIGVTCATHIFNKEVTEETETATINYMYETNEVNTEEDLIDGNIYKLTFNTYTSDLSFLYATKLIYISNLQDYEIYFDSHTDRPIGQFFPICFKITNHEFVYTQIYNTIGDTSQNITMTFTENKTIQLLFVYNRPNTDWIETYENLSPSLQFTIEQAPQNLIPIQSVNITTNPQDQTTNIFYDSCEQVEQSFILNWCEQANPVRGPIQNFTNAFSLPNNHIINTLITYWLCIAMIYIVIDIIVECVIIITHFFNKEF